MWKEGAPGAKANVTKPVGQAENKPVKYGRTSAIDREQIDSTRFERISKDDTNCANPKAVII